MNTALSLASDSVVSDSQESLFQFGLKEFLLGTHAFSLSSENMISYVWSELPFRFSSSSQTFIVHFVSFSLSETLQPYLLGSWVRHFSSDARPTSQFLIVSWNVSCGASCVLFFFFAYGFLSVCVVLFCCFFVFGFWTFVRPWLCLRVAFGLPCPSMLKLFLVLERDGSIALLLFAKSW